MSDVTTNALLLLGVVTTTLTLCATLFRGEMMDRNSAAESVPFDSVVERFRREKQFRIRQQESQNHEAGAGAGALPAESVPKDSSASCPVPASLHVVERLKRKFGLGDQPAKRLKLYQRLAKLAAVHGDVVLSAISEAVCQSVGKDKPGRYFCRAVCGRLADLGLSENGGTEDARW